MTAHKTLYMVRHARSDWPSGNLNDFDRPISNQGQRDALEMGRRLKAQNAIPEVIFCSPAKRARETLSYLDLGIENVRFEDRMYCASQSDLLEIVQAIPDQYSSAMLLGHNPAMTWLAGYLSETLIHDLPACAVVTADMECRNWSEAGACPGRLQDYDFPKKQE